MKIALLALAAALPGLLFPQTERGGKTLPNPINFSNSTTRAVVVGISDYQSPQIPDLQFADSDAVAFADWLKSDAGGRVAAEDIAVLTNEKATNARIGAALDELVEVAKEGDRIIIYFSGHGDVETKTFNQLGFLLAWDTPPTNYKVGAYSLTYLQDVVSTLSILTKARVTVITDACHAGKLAGSGIGGPQATAQALAKQFANEVKIMSCQANEFSLEGTQWGGGRGCFSFHLIDGLTGLADNNGDGTVSLLEIGRFLEEKVPAETAPLPQTPITVGDRGAFLAKVDADALAELLKTKSGQPPHIGDLGSKGLDLLAESDSMTRATYHAFENALAAGNLMENGSSADFFYKKILENGIAGDSKLHGLMRRSLAVALQDEVQQAINSLLADDPYAVNNWLYNPQKFTDYPRYLHRAIELLGEKHYMVPTLRAKELYFEGYLIAQSLGTGNASEAFQDSVRALAKGKMLEAVAQDPLAAYPYYSIAMLHYYQRQTDSVVLWGQRAIERAPTWLLPYLDISYEHHRSNEDNPNSEAWLKKAIAIAPNSYTVQERLSWLYQWQNRLDESLAVSEKMILERPELFNAYSAAGATCVFSKDFARAEAYFQKSKAIEPSFNNWASDYYIVVLARTRRQRAAISLADSILNHRAVNADARRLGLSFLVTSLNANHQTKLAVQIIKNYEGFIQTGPLLSYEEMSVLAKYEVGKGHYSEGRALMQKLVDITPHLTGPDFLQINLEAIIAEKEGQLAQADSLFRAALSFRSVWNWEHMSDRLYGLTEILREEYFRFLMHQKRTPEAVAQAEKLMEEEPNSWRGHYCMAIVEAEKEHQKAALDWLEKSLDRWLPTPELTEYEPYFSKIKKTKRFKAMMLKNFPPGWEKN